jgi:lipopolysaccharide/colanic/teichoic acid biosynthesis glycosyltransferase
LVTKDERETRRYHAWEEPARRAVDVLLAAAGLVLLAVPIAVIAVLIRLESRAPAILRQQRVGLGRRAFTLYKFRTMRVGGSDAAHRELIVRELAGEDTSTNGSWKLDDDRVTRIGGFLRRTSLDELPQLVNVLRGDMALVGPRPCLDWEADLFPPQFGERFDVRPGLTGLWQVSGRSTVGTLEMLQLDVMYVRRRRFWSDLAILVMTVPVLLRRDGAR